MQQQTNMKLLSEIFATLNPNNRPVNPVPESGSQIVCFGFNTDATFSEDDWQPGLLVNTCDPMNIGYMDPFKHVR